MSTVCSVWCVDALDTISDIGVTPAVEVSGTNATFQVTAAGVGTDVSFQLEGSVDGVGFFNLDATGSSHTITADGTYGYPLGAAFPVRYVRLRLTAFNGGTPSISCIVGQM